MLLRHTGVSYALLAQLVGRQLIVEEEEIQLPEDMDTDRVAGGMAEHLVVAVAADAAEHMGPAGRGNSDQMEVETS